MNAEWDLWEVTRLTRSSSLAPSPLPLAPPLRSPLVPPAVPPNIPLSPRHAPPQVLGRDSAPAAQSAGPLFNGVALFGSMSCVALLLSCKHRICRKAGSRLVDESSAGGDRATRKPAPDAGAMPAASAVSARAVIRPRPYAQLKDPSDAHVQLDHPGCELENRHASRDAPTAAQHEEAGDSGGAAEVQPRRKVPGLLLLPPSKRDLD